MQTRIEEFISVFRRHTRDAALPPGPDRPPYSHMPLRRTLKALRPNSTEETDIIQIILTQPIKYENNLISAVLWYQRYCHNLGIPIETVAKMFTIWYRDQEDNHFPVHKYPFHPRICTESTFLINIELAPMLHDFCKGIKLYDVFTRIKEFDLDLALLTLGPESLINPCDDVLFWLFEFHRLPSILDMVRKDWRINEFSTFLSILIKRENLVSHRTVPLVYRYRKEAQTQFASLDTPKGKGLPRLLALYLRFEHYQRHMIKADLLNPSIIIKPAKDVTVLLQKHRTKRGRHVCYDPIYYHAIAVCMRKGISLGIFDLDGFVKYYRSEENKGFVIEDGWTFFDFLDRLADKFNPNALESSCIRLLVEQKRLLRNTTSIKL